MRRWCKTAIVCKQAPDESPGNLGRKVRREDERWLLEKEQSPTLSLDSTLS